VLTTKNGSQLKRKPSSKEGLNPWEKWEKVIPKKYPELKGAFKGPTLNNPKSPRNPKKLKGKSQP